MKLRHLKKILFWILIFFLLLSPLFFSYIQKIQGQNDPDTRTFTNTQNWDKSLYKLVNTADTSLFIDIVLPPPPNNTSEKINDEIALLHAYKSRRTPEKIKEIETEREFAKALFGTSTLETLVHTHPKTETLLLYVLRTIEPTILFQKRYFNRVRPSFLDTSLTTVIDIPNHPAYPSGHSTQAHSIAYVLSTLNPENKEMYKTSARRIAQNREIAGVHYPSDSEVGVLLAQEMMNILSKEPIYIELLKEAKTEW